MTWPTTPPPLAMRLVAAAGALLAGAGVALLAYAAHAGGDPQAHARLFDGGLLALVHGATLAVAARRTHGIGRAAMALLLLGTLVFTGSLVAAHATGGRAPLAPLGGGCTIVAWLLYAIARARP